MITLIIHGQRGSARRTSRPAPPTGRRARCAAATCRPPVLAPTVVARPADHRPPGRGRARQPGRRHRPGRLRQDASPPPSGTSPTPAPSPGSSLDALDDDAAHLVAHIATALADRELLDTEDVRFLSSPGARPGSSWCRPCSRSSTTAPPFVLVLDDVHLLRDDEAAGRARLARRRRSRPRGARPAQPHAPRPSASPADASPSQVVELGPDRAGLHRRRRGQGLHRARGHRSTPDRLAEVVERCEGWAGGIHLAALALRDRDGAQRPITGRNRLVADYLVEEVLNGLDDDTARFLEEASILEPMSARPARRGASAAPTPGAQLAAVEASGNLFLIALDDERDVVPLPPPLRRAADLPARPARPRPTRGAAPAGLRGAGSRTATSTGPSTTPSGPATADRAAALVQRAGGDAHLRRSARRAGPPPRPPRRDDRLEHRRRRGGRGVGRPRRRRRRPDPGRGGSRHRRSTTRARSPTARRSVAAALALIAGIIGDGGLEGVMRNTTFVIESGGPEVNPWWGMALTVQGDGAHPARPLPGGPRPPCSTPVSQMHTDPRVRGRGPPDARLAAPPRRRPAHRGELRRRRASHRRPPRARPRRPAARRLLHRRAHRGPHRRHRPGPPRASTSSTPPSPASARTHPAPASSATSSSPRPSTPSRTAPRPGDT